MMYWTVATREGGVDRNKQTLPLDTGIDSVATREGGVDRNTTAMMHDALCDEVATREGGVDRNTLSSSAKYACISSPPARVAWIETMN